MKREKNTREFFTTGVLIGIIVLLIIILALLVTGYRRVIRESDTLETEFDMESELVTDSGTDTESETDTDSDSDTEESEFVFVIGMDETEALSESEQETTAENEKEKLVVAIDPGHQGSWVDMSDTEPLGPGSSEMKAKSSTGTQGTYSGVPEYELNLEISLQLRTELEERGYDVILTREDNDTAISNAERATLAYEQGGDIYVRIHANGSEDSSVSGALAMVPSASNPYVGELAEDSYLLAECILSAYCETAGFDSLGIQYYDNMTGINWSKIPVMILEMGFMTNESDDLRMTDSSVQTLMVQGIADGIDDYFVRKGLKEEVSSDLEEETEAETGTEMNMESDSDAAADTYNESDEIRMNSLAEILGEGYIYPAAEVGETWAVSVMDLNNGLSCDINGDVQLKSASVLKVFIMAAVYDRVIYPSSEELQIVVEESYEGELDDLITQMITLSSNTASNTLVTFLGQGDVSAGRQVVNDFLEENGYTGTFMGRLFLEENPAGDNYTTSNDCMRLLADIYQGVLAGEQASEEMYEYLKLQTLKEKIPAGLAEKDVSTANKTGELAGDYGDYVENDIAIIVSDELAYILCVLSNDLQDNSTAVSRIVQISEQVYEMLAN